MSDERWMEGETFIACEFLDEYEHDETIWEKLTTEQMKAVLDWSIEMFNNMWEESDDHRWDFDALDDVVRALEWKSMSPHMDGSFVYTGRGRLTSAQVEVLHKTIDRVDDDPPKLRVVKA